MALAERDEWIVVTKDDDFVQSYWVNGQPSRLLLIATGNIGNTELEKIILANIHTIAAAFMDCRFIEISRQMVVIHE